MNNSGAKVAIGGILHLAGLGQGVADLEVAGADQADDVPRKCHLDGLSVAAEELVSELGGEGSSRSVIGE